MVLSLAFSSVLPAQPAPAKSFCGDFYLGLQIGNLPGLDAASIPTQAMKLPFAGKLYYQDGVFRIDLDLPSSLTAEAPAERSTPTGPLLQGAGFHVYTLLLPLRPGTITLIDHSARRAYSFDPPPEWASQWRTPTETNPFDALKNPETISQLAGQGIRIVHTGRIKSKDFDGLATNAYEMKMKVRVPLEAMKDMPADFKPYFTLHIYFEKETGFPLEFSFLSDLFNFSFRLANLQTGPLPKALFSVPQFYAEKTFTEGELMELLEEFAGSFGSEFSKQMQKVPWSSQQPAGEGAEGGARAAPSQEAGAEGAPAPSTGGGGKRFLHPPPGMVQ